MEAFIWSRNSSRLARSLRMGSGRSSSCAGASSRGGLSSRVRAARFGGEPSRAGTAEGGERKPFAGGDPEAWEDRREEILLFRSPGTINHEQQDRLGNDGFKKMIERPLNEGNENILPEITLFAVLSIQSSTQLNRI